VGYMPEAWRGFGEAIAGLSGTLTGLLFVAVSLKSDILAKSISLRSRAAQTLVLFMTSVLVAIVLAAPQPPAGIGPELLVISAVTGAVLFVLDRRAGHDSESRVARYIEAASPNLLTAVLVAIGGLTYIVDAGGGLYWLIPAVVASLVGGVINAWLFLVSVTG
jgi:hypothetical protein